MADARINALATTATAPAVDDFLALDGTTNGTRKLGADWLWKHLGVTPPVGFPISDGATTDRAERAQYGDVGDVAGLPASFVCEFVVPASLPASDGYLFALSSTPSSSPPNVANAIFARFMTNGTLRIRAGATTPTTNNRQFNYADFHSDYSGQAVRLSVVFTEGDSTTAPTIHANGEDISSEFSGTTNGTPPNWMDTDLDTTYSLSGYNWPAGRAPYSRVIVGALSDTEAANYTAGMPLEQAAPWTRFAGSAELNNQSTAANGSSPFATFSGESATGVTFADSSGSARRLSWLLSGPFVTGQTYAITFDWAYTSGTATISLQRRIAADGGVQETITNNLFTSSGARAYTFVWDGNGEYLTINKATNGDNSISAAISNLRVYPLGPLDRPIYQPALVTDDAFGRFSRRLVGMTPVSSKSDFRIIGNTATSGNEQVLSGAVLEDSDAVIDSVEFDTDGTPTITLGSASGGAQYVASTALSAGLNADETLVTRKAASTALWVGSNSTANVRTYVSGHKINGV